MFFTLFTFLAEGEKKEDKKERMQIYRGTSNPNPTIINF